MDLWPWIHGGLDVVIVGLVLRITVTLRSHQHVSVQVSQRFAPHFIVVGEDK